MNRRRFLSWTASALGGAGLAAHKLNAQEPANANAAKAASVPGGRSRPNVLFIMSDQHKRACMGVAGDRVARTPNLDRLAEQSVRFTSAYCTNPVCAPSRASIVTGRYTHNLRGPRRLGSIPYGHKSVADYFNNAGYLTASIGKMHFLDAQTHGFRYRLDFNDWFQYLGPQTRIFANEMGGPGSGAGFPEIPSIWSGEGDPWKSLIVPDGRLGHEAVGRPSLMDEAEQFDGFVARESIRFLEDYARKDQPFFLITSFLKPHQPFMPAKRFAEMYHAEQMKLSPTWGKADLATLPKEVVHSIETSPYTPELIHPAEARKRMAYYYGNLAEMDDCAGQVLSALERTGLDRNTIVVYSADHGEMLGDLGLWAKFQFYEGSCGVPLLVRMPGGAPAVCDVPVSQISLVATLADLCNVEMSGPSDGKSFADLVRQPNSGLSYGPVFAEFALGTRNEKYMIREGRYKYTYWTHDIPELYDLTSDPEELHNLAVLPQHKATVEELKSRLFAWHRPPEA